jgi:hypothetical protein
MAGRFAVILLVLLYVAPFLIASAGNGNSFTWKAIDDDGALCNDFSRAGYLIKRTEGSNKWLIFLESGGLCYSPESCNRRFFHPFVRREFSSNTGADSLSITNPDFNMTDAWGTLEERDEPISQRINPLMTSLNTFIRDGYNSDDIQGRDLLDSDITANPTFYDYNHVNVPYCSSDLWLGNDSRAFDFVASDVEDLQAEFLTYWYRPESDNLQFTFRGLVIFRSIIAELASELNNASEIILAGSSAGGIGVVNHAKWIYDQFNANISIITDSSWFIDFRGTITKRFDESVAESTNDNILSIISQSPQCSISDDMHPP